VATAQDEDQTLLFEAGTGVGKSLAYLLPGIIHAVDQSRQMLVSTHTIALQEQLDHKDLPLCRRVLSSRPEWERYAGFKSAVLLGKGNYLCTTRLATALRDKHELVANAEFDELQRIAAWAETSASGIVHELNPRPAPDVWDLVNADSSSCSRKYCDGERCFYQRARVRLRTAQVIIVNHSLLFALLAAGAGGATGRTRGVLLPDDFLVLDEAHTVPEVATDHGGLRISSYGTDRMLKFLYNPRTGRGLLQRHGGAAEQQLVVDALDAAHLFFEHLATRVLRDKGVLRVREAGCAEPLLDEPLQALQRAVRSRADKLDEGRERDELLEQVQRLKTYQSGINEFLSLAEADRQVYWLERGGRRGTVTSLRAAPIDIAPFLRERLFTRGTSVVLTSATLAVAGRLDALRKRLGADETPGTIVHSPFDFARHMRVYLATDVPMPTGDGARLDREVLIDYIDFCTRRVAGGSLVLFTSYQDMRAVAAVMEPIYDGARRPFFLQGRDHSSSELARQLRAAGNGVLFGTDSFWTGVDIPGDSLAQVIITRLPFEVPTHPVLEARTEWVRERGGRPFEEITLPDALMKFRQGVGRLIRTAQDRGLITVLDSRLTQKAYGRLFIDSLPIERPLRMNRRNRLEIFRPFT